MSLTRVFLLGILTGLILAIGAYGVHDVLFRLDRIEQYLEAVSRMSHA